AATNRRPSAARLVLTRLWSALLGLRACAQLRPGHRRVRLHTHGRLVCRRAQTGRSRRESLYGNQITTAVLLWKPGCRTSRRQARGWTTSDPEAHSRERFGVVLS